MKTNFTVFYSWQSDTKYNKNYIQKCIDKATKEVTKRQKKELKLDLEINVDRDTRNKSGSPEIVETILKKISACDIFICDITIINKNFINKLFKLRLTPNPNVLIELGYAINILGWDRIICVQNIENSNIEELPFDIRGHRITPYKGNTQNYKVELTSILTIAIESIINNYDEIINKQAKNNNKNHDLNIYYKISNICDETILHDSISTAVNSLYTNRHYTDIWALVKRFYGLSINKFIDSELDSLMNVFLKELDGFDDITATNFHSVDDDPNYLKYILIKANGGTLTEDEEFDFKQSQVYRPIKRPFHNEEWYDADLRIANLQDKLLLQGEKVKDSYRDLIMKVKQKLM